ncbi:MAG TPA: helix-turn-helix domain-containing protein [Acidimicrobiia bacterium]|jgi:AcrR family transcriptional regulator
MAEQVKPRGYTSPLRDRQAAETRARILDAAAALFEARGYGSTTVRAIAERSDVAVDTVYATFGTKGRILTALIDQRLAPRGDANVMERPEAIAVRDEPDQRRQLHLFARDIAEVVERVGPVYEIMRTSSTVEPAMAAVHAEMDGYRLRNMRAVAGWLADNGSLRVDVDRAAQIIWALASPDVARMLRVGQGWTSEEYADWLEDTLARALLDP